jgi:hypothetical protein
MAAFVIAVGVTPVIASGKLEELLPPGAPAPLGRPALRDGLVAMAGRAFFVEHSNDGYGPASLWTSDGTPTGTQPIASFALGIPSELYSAAGHLFFLAAPNEVWVSDGTPAGTRRVLEGLLVYPPLVEHAGRAFFTSRLPNTTLWTSDATPEGTKKVADLPGGRGDLFSAGGRLFIGTAGVWSTDGTPEGTMKVLKGDDDLGMDFVAAREFLFAGFHSVTSGRWELWRMDGTPAGSAKVTDHPSGVPLGTFLIPSFPHDTRMLAVGNRVFYLAYDDDRMWALWVTDGSGAPVRLTTTAQPALCFPPTTHTLPLCYQYGIDLGAALNDTLVFTRDDRLWSSDGTAAGTVPLDVASPGEFEAPLQVNDTVYFGSPGDAFALPALWRTDGTTRGTKRLAGLPGNLQRIVNVSGRLFMLAQSALLTLDVPCADPALARGERLACELRFGLDDDECSSSKRVLRIRTRAVAPLQRLVRRFDRDRGVRLERLTRRVDDALARLRRRLATRHERHRLGESCAKALRFGIERLRRSAARVPAPSASAIR